MMKHYKWVKDEITKSQQQKWYEEANPVGQHTL